MKNFVMQYAFDASSGDVVTGSAKKMREHLKPGDNPSSLGRTAHHKGV
jgi:hypothetical protein